MKNQLERQMDEMLEFQDLDNQLQQAKRNLELQKKRDEIEMKVQMRVELRNESQQLMVERTKQIAKGQFRAYKELKDKFTEHRASVH